MDKGYILKQGNDDQARLNSLSEIYDKSSQEFVINSIKQKKQKSVKKILDIGCGQGSMTHFFAQQFPQAKILSLDISQDQLTIAKKRTQAEKNVQYYQLDIESNNLNQKIVDELKSADVIYVRYLLLHLRNWEVFFNHAYQLLKPGGTLIIEEPGFPWTTYPHSEILQKSADVSQTFLHSLGYRFDCIPHLWEWLHNQDQFKLEDVEFSHPTLKTYHQKSLMWMSFAQLKDPLISAQLYNEEEFEKILDELKRIAKDDKYIGIPLRLIQVSLTK